MIPDLLVVGSGPAGAQAAKAAIDAGASVQMLDFGNDDPAGRASVPDAPFSVVRRTDPEQARYLWGARDVWNPYEGNRVAGHLTAPRAFALADADRLLPVASDTFTPVRSLALGGLGAAWGAGTPCFEDHELVAMGLPVEAMAAAYDEVVRDIGVSAAWDDDTAPYVLRSRATQPAAEPDTNARALLAAYARRRDAVRAAGFTLGRAPLALLTQPIRRPGCERDANPYFDMDFYGDARRSIYRPRYTIDELRAHPRFTYTEGVLVHAFASESDRAVVHGTDRRGEPVAFAGRRAILATGALNSARIALRSFGIAGERQPLLSNEMSFLIALNLAMLGRTADDRRHSLAQLLAIYAPDYRGGERVAASIYSYRSLLNVRLATEFPMPTRLGVPTARLLTNALTIAGVHHPERRSARKWVALARADGDLLNAHYELDGDERRANARDAAGIAAVLRRLGCVTLRRIATPHGASIHYAGTLPMRAPGERAPLQTDEAGRIVGAERVHVADSATWRALPAKGLTLTIMANARRVARLAVETLRAEARA